MIKSAMSSLSRSPAYIALVPHGREWRDPPDINDVADLNGT
jgi:hypothetical protein